MLAHVRRRGPVKTSDFKSERPGRRLVGLEDGAELALERSCSRRRADDRPPPQLPADLRPARSGCCRAGTTRQMPPIEQVRAHQGSWGRGAVRALGITSARWVADYYRQPAQRDTAGLPAGAGGRGPAHRGARGGLGGARRTSAENRALAEAAASGALVAGADHAALAVRPAGVGSRARAGDVRLRLPDRVLHPGAQAPLRLLHAADPVARASWSAGPTRRRTRKEGRFEVKALHLEPGVARPGRRCSATWPRAITASARWHGTPVVRLGRRVAVPLKAALGAWLDGNGPATSRSRPGRRPTSRGHP